MLLPSGSSLPPPKERCFCNLNLKFPLKLRGPTCKVASLQRFSKFSFDKESILKRTSHQKLTLEFQVSPELGQDVTSLLCESPDVTLNREHHGDVPKNLKKLPLQRQSDSTMFLLTFTLTEVTQT